MNSILHYLLIIHVIAGVGALVSGLGAIMLRKKTTKHKPFGRFYFWCMTIVFVTAIILSVAKQLLFLFFIAVFSYYAVAIAYRALQLRELHKGQKPGRIDWLIQIAAGLVFTGMLAYAVIVSSGGASVVIIVFSSLGILGVYNNSKLIFRGPKKTNYWLSLHVGNMLGSYIGAITAFLVNQTDKIPVNPLVLWLGPTIIIVPFIMMETRKIKSEPL